MDYESELQDILKNDLLLKSQVYHRKNRALIPECIPQKPREGRDYEFGIKGAVNQYAKNLYQQLDIGEIVIFAEIEIIEKQEIKRAGELWTLGVYKLKK